MARSKKVVASEVPTGDPYDIPEIDGFMFRWTNAKVRTKMGRWKIWSPLKRSSELGEKVAALIEDVTSPAFKELVQSDSDLFCRGDALVLAFAPKDKVLAARAASQKKADDKLRMVHQTEGAKLRHTYIQKDPEDI